MSKAGTVHKDFAEIGDVVYHNGIYFQVDGFRTDSFGNKLMMSGTKLRKTDLLKDKRQKAKVSVYLNK